jgi:transglutaminase-like putative cysteine protease
VPAEILRAASAALIVLLLGGVLPAQERRPNPRRQQSAPQPAAQTPPAPAPAATASDVPSRAGEIRIESRVTVPAGAQRLDLWVPTPRQSDSQTVLEAAAPTPPGAVLTQHQDAASGNTFLHLRIDDPTGVVTFTASWTFERREEAKSRFRRGAIREGGSDGASFAADLAPSTLVPVTGRMKARASLIAPGESDPLNVARAIYDEVLRTVEHSTKGEGWGRGDALFALDAGHGDATDLVALFVGLARARGIPARFAMGLPLPEARADQEAEIAGATAWAQFFVPDLGWIPVDLALAAQRKEQRQACFGNLDERRIHFTTGRDVQTAPPGKHGAHNFFIYPHAEIDGETVAVARRLTFKEK